MRLSQDIENDWSSESTESALAGHRGAFRVSICLLPLVLVRSVRIIFRGRGKCRVPTLGGGAWHGPRLSGVP